MGEVGSRARHAVVALLLVLSSMPVLAVPVEGATMPYPFVQSSASCLGAGAVLHFNTVDWYGDFGYSAFGAAVYANGGYGTTSYVGRIPVYPTGYGTYYAAGDITLPTPLPAALGGVVWWTIRQSSARQYTGRFPNYDATKWTCRPTVAANPTCLPTTGGSLTLSGQVNHVNEDIDVGFDIDPLQTSQPSTNILNDVGYVGADGTFAVTFRIGALSAGVHTFYVGTDPIIVTSVRLPASASMLDSLSPSDTRSVSATVGWYPFDQDTYRDGTDIIVRTQVQVPCPRASIAITPGVVDFGTIDVGASSGPLAFTVTNVGTIGAPINGLAIDGANPADFVIESNGCDGAVLPPASPGAGVTGTCEVAVHFTPGGAGARAATLTVTSANTATASANLSGTGVVPPGLTISPTGKNFGSVPTGSQSDAATFTVTNTGSAPQTITSVTLTGSQAGQFTVDPDTCGGVSVAGGATCTVMAAFKPSTTGSQAATLVVGSDANISVPATLRGTGQAGILGFDPNPADFGTIAIGSSSDAITIKVTNGGGAGLTVSAVRVGGADPGEFFVSGDGCTGHVLGPGATCTVAVFFKPAGPGDRNATLDLENDFGTASGGLRGAGIFQAILKFTPPTAQTRSLATVVGRSFPRNTRITLQWQEPGIHAPIAVMTDATGAFTVSFMIMAGEKLGARHLEPAPDPGVLDEPRPVAVLLVQAPTFRPQAQAALNPALPIAIVARG